MPDSLAVMQVKESHATALSSDNIFAMDYCALAVAPRLGMAVFDKFTATWKGINEKGSQDSSYTKTLKISDVGSMIVWPLDSRPLDSTSVVFVSQGGTYISYGVLYANATRPMLYAAGLSGVINQNQALMVEQPNERQRNAAVHSLADLAEGPFG